MGRAKFDVTTPSAANPPSVAAYVQRNAEPYKEWVTAATSPDVGSPRERILSLFDSLVEQVQPEYCRGCPFMMTLAEFPDADVLARRHAIATKAWVRDRFRGLTQELAAEAPVADPTELADQLALVMEGVYATVQALGGDAGKTGKDYRRDPHRRCQRVLVSRA